MQSICIIRELTNENWFTIGGNELSVVLVRWPLYVHLCFLAVKARLTYRMFIRGFLCKLCWICFLYGLRSFHSDGNSFVASISFSTLLIFIATCKDGFGEREVGKSHILTEEQQQQIPQGWWQSETYLRENLVSVSLTTKVSSNWMVTINHGFHLSNI